MQGKRIKIEVEVNLDQVPGWGYDPQDFVKLIEKHLNQAVPHYMPKVRLSDDNA